MMQTITVFPSHVKTFFNKLWWILLIAFSLLVLMPLGAVLLELALSNLSIVKTELLSKDTVKILYNSIELSIFVTVGAAFLGIILAFFVLKMSSLNKFFTIALALPLAIPDFVMALSFLLLFPKAQGILPASLVMICATYPLVFLPVRNALMAQDANLIDIYKVFNLSNKRIFLTQLSYLKQAIASGAILVFLASLSEYGTYALLGYQTLTTYAYSIFRIAGAGNQAFAVSLVIVIVGIIITLLKVLLVKSQLLSLSAQVSVAHSHQSIPTSMKIIAAALLSITTGICLLYPLVISLINANFNAILNSETYRSIFYSLFYAGVSSVVIVIASLVIIFISYLRPLRVIKYLAQFSVATLSIPAIIIGVSYTYIFSHYLPWFYLNPITLIASYVAMFFPLGFSTLYSYAQQLPKELVECALTHKLNIVKTFLRVFIPEMIPSLATATLLSFVSIITELILTLILIPTGQTTLATTFWNYASNFDFHQAAFYSLMLIIIPSALFSIALVYQRTP
jgi:iron(III) transport system permease protein